MRTFICVICGYVYDEAKGIPEAGIAPGTSWDDLPADWTCPLCGASKAEFKEQSASATSAAPATAATFAAAPVVAPATTAATTQVSKIPIETDLKELSPLEISDLCTNLAKACEKQYKPEEAGLFNQLADYFKKAAPPAREPGFDNLIALIEKDLSEGLPAAHVAADYDSDRGAKRALVWSEKVTRILNSLLTRYQTEGDAMIENTGVYVCTICGFVYIGDDLPEVCPVCKVPKWKFEKVEGR